MLLSRRVEGVTPSRIPPLLWSGSILNMHIELERVKSPQRPTTRIAIRCASPRSGDPVNQEQRPGTGTKAPALMSIFDSSPSTRLEPTDRDATLSASSAGTSASHGLRVSTLNKEAVPDLLHRSTIRLLLTTILLLAVAYTNHSYCQSIIFRSGDVETNPGPKLSVEEQNQICEHCGGPPASRFPLLRCTQPDCTNRCHSAPDCCKIKKNVKNKIWTCLTHRDAETDLRMNRDITCDFCSQPARTGAYNCAVTGCPKVVHQKTACSNVERRQTNVAWLCSVHKTSAQALSEEARNQLALQEEAKLKCYHCNIKPQSCHGHYSCADRSCSVIAHKSEACSDLTRSKQRVTTVWRCREHRPTAPAPRHPHIGKPCDHCGDKMKSTSNPMVCTDCDRVCHTAFGCSKIQAYRRNQSAQWKCKLHNPGAAATPPPPADAPPEPGSKCIMQPTSNCSGKIASGKRGLKCSEHDCPSVCHRQLKCSGIKPQVRNPTWTCPLHDDASQANISQSDVQAPAVALPPQDNTGDEDEAAPGPPRTPPHVGLPCSKPSCKRKMNRGTDPVTCMEPDCGKTFHRGCTNITRFTIAAYRSGNIHWACDQCLEKQKGTDNKTTHSQDPTDGKESEGKSKSRSSLRILQWNARGINNKMEELRTMAKELEVDVITIQETHLTKGNKVPFIPGYSPVRADRKNKGRGGLLSFVATSLPMQRIKDESKNATEVSTFAVRLKKNKWAKISNTYCPPDSPAYEPGFVQLRTDIIPTSPNTIICGDFNAHAPLWDNIQPTDERGNEVIDFSAASSLNIINDGSPTRTSPETGQGSSPDITLAGSFWSNKASWSVIDNSMGSDHFPILIELKCNVSHTPAFQGAPKWKIRDADWENFRKDVDDRMDEVDTSTSLKNIIGRFNDIVLESAGKHIGKAKPGKNSHVWLTPHVRAII